MERRGERAVVAVVVAMQTPFLTEEDKGVSGSVSLDLTTASTHHPRGLCDEMEDWDAWGRWGVKGRGVGGPRGNMLFKDIK